MQDGRTRVSAQHCGGEQRCRRTSRETATQLIDDEDTVSITIERQSDIEATRHHARLQVTLVRWLNWVGRMIRK